METTNSDNSGDKSETADSDEPNHMKVKWMMTQPKPMLMRRNRRVEGCQICRVKVKVVEGLRSKKTDRRVEKRGSGQVVEHVPRGKLAKGAEVKNR